MLIGTEPADGSVVATAPSRVRMDFSEDVSASGNGVRVLDPAGGAVSGVSVRSDGDALVADLPRLDREGTYTVVWNAISADGHPVAGAWVFSVGHASASGAATASTPAAATGLRLPAWLRVLEVAGLAAAFCGAGLAAGSFVLSRRVHEAAALAAAGPWSWATAAAGVVVVTAAVAGALAGGGAGLAAIPRLVVAGVAGTCLVLAFVASLVGMAAPPRAWTAWLGIAALLLLAGAGHALVLEPRAVGYALQAAHVLAVATWGAGVVWLARGLRRGADPGPAVDRVLRFSPTAAACAVVAAATGVALLLLRVPLGDLLATDYGRLGLVKVGLLFVVAGIGALNRWHWARHRRFGALATSVRVEAGLIAVTVVVGSLLGTTAPPVAVTQEAAAPVRSAQGGFGPYVASVTLGPAVAGANDLHVTVVTQAGLPATDLEDLRVELREPDAGIGPLRPAVSPVEPGHVAALGVVLPVAGTWRVDVIADRGRFERLRASFPLTVR